MAFDDRSRFQARGRCHAQAHGDDGVVGILSRQLCDVGWKRHTRIVMMHGWGVVVLRIVMMGTMHVQIERLHVEAREGDYQNDGAGASENLHVIGA